MVRVARSSPSDRPFHELEELVEEPVPSLETRFDIAHLLKEMERRGKITPSSPEERQRVIQEEHAKGHFGRESVYRSLYARGHWWIGMRRDIQDELRGCVPCLRHVIAKRGFNPATPITAALPWDHIQIDSVVHLKPSKPEGYTAMLVVVDVCTGFVILRPVLSTKAQHVAPELWKLFNDFGFPRVIQSDNGSEYTNHIVKEMIKQAGVSHRYITAYQPRTDGKVERNIGTAKSIIRKHLFGVEDHWPAFVPWAQSCMNNRITELTGSTPFSLMFGRRFNPYQDYSTSAPLETMAETEWAQLQDRMIAVIYPSIAERVALQKLSLKKRLDKRHRAVKYKKGDIVMLRRPESIMGQPLGAFEAHHVGPYMVESVSNRGLSLLSPPPVHLSLAQLALTN